MSCDNKRPCPCTYDCLRHGKCCECVAHHRDHDEGVPGCFFSREAEATYEKNLAHASVSALGVVFRVLDALAGA